MFLIKRQAYKWTYGKTEAIEDLKKSFPAHTEAAWVGYAMVIYIKTLRKVRKIPVRRR
jgi:hypothetical protein